MPVVESLYEAPWYARNALVMSFWANTLRRVSKVDYDGHLTIGNKPTDYFDIMRKRVDRDTTSHRAVLIAPGLEGGDNAKYVRGMVEALNHEGFDVFVWVYRDTGAEATHVKRTYHGADTLGLIRATHEVAKEYAHVSLVGFSLGAGLISQYLSGTNVHASVENAVLFSTPIDLGRTTQMWSNTWLLKLLMKRAALAGMRGKALRKVYNGTLTWDELYAYDKVSTVAEADHYINTKFNGFSNAWKYWYEGTSKYQLHQIAVPTLMVTARDDYLLSVESYPLEDALNENVTFEQSSNGSHISFVPKGWPKHRYWSEKRAIQFLAP